MQSLQDCTLEEKTILAIVYYCQSNE